MTAEEEFCVGAECGAPPANDTLGKEGVQRRAKSSWPGCTLGFLKTFTTKVRGK